MHATGAELSNSWGVLLIGTGAVRDGGNKGFGVKVATMHSSVDDSTSDLATIAGGYDFVNGANDPTGDMGRGAHVGGTIAALDDGSRVAGVDLGAGIYALKVLDSTGSRSFSNIISAFQWAVDNGIQVTNDSCGSCLNPGSAVEAVFINSMAAGVIHVASTGNTGNGKDKDNNAGYPARYASVIAGAATDSNDDRASLSSTGSALELAAPGVAINATAPAGNCELSDASGYLLLNGTSMASPHVTGTVALMIASGVAGILGVLHSTADDLGKRGLDIQYG